MELAVQIGGGQVRRDKPGIEGIVEQAVLAEKLGFSTAFVPDHYVAEALGKLQTETPLYELFFVMATLAQRTKSIRIGSHVACMLFRHPAMHARLFAQVDEASNGRVIAGVGAGWTRAEFEMMGIDFPDVSERLERMDEAVTVMRGLWKNEPFSFDGRFYRVRDAVCLPKPVQKPGPPIMLGGSGNGILRRAGEWADIIHMVPVIGAAGTTTLEEIAKFTDTSLNAKLARVRMAEQKAGRNKGCVRFASTIFSYAMTQSEAETTQIAEPLAKMFNLSVQDLLRHPVSLIGTAEQMAEELRRREATHGLSMLAINFANLEQLKDFGEKVIPKM
jgi:probable F420-dependent oxidoreductase